MAGDSDSVRRLIAAGANVDAQDSLGLTALHFAAQQSNIEAVQALLENAASVEIRDVHGNTALWTATFNSRGHGEIIVTLLDRGSDPDALNNSGVSPRMLAERIGNYDVRQLFSE